MKFIIPIILIAVLSLIIQPFAPWWIPGLVALLVGAFYIKEVTSFQSFSIGFLAIFLLWGVWSFFSDTLNEGILSNRIGELFGGLNAISLILITALIGGFLGGIGALSGKLAREAAS